MSKRMQQGTGEERIVAKSKPTLNLVSHTAGGSNQNDAALSSQVWLTDAKMNERARKLVVAGTKQELSFQECARKLATENSDINDEDDSKWPHNYRRSRANVPHLEKVYSNLRQ